MTPGLEVLWEELRVPYWLVPGEDGYETMGWMGAPGPLAGAGTKLGCCC